MIALDNATHWSKRRIINVLRNLADYEAGLVLDNRTTCYTEAEHTAHGVSSKAYFIEGVETAAEATLRVERARKSGDELLVRLSRARVKHFDDGELVKRIYVDGWDCAKIARLVRCRESDVWYRVNRAMRYASSDDCLIVSYKEWCRINHR